MLIIRKSISLTELWLKERKKFPNTYSVYMVRLDTPTDALVVANLIIAFRLILKITLSSELNFKKSKSEESGSSSWLILMLSGMPLNVPSIILF